MKRLGPELKMPDLKNAKAPAWAADLYFDMRDRRLLLPIALVVVAIAAMPFLLGDSEVEIPPPVEDGATAEAGTGADATTLTVVEAKPGLRDYKKRLERRSPTDPFVQKYTNVPGSAKVESTVAESPGSGGGEEEVSVTVTERGTGGDSSGGSGGGGASPKPGGRGTQPRPGSDGQRYFAYRPNVRFGVAGSDELNEYRHLKLGKPLPKRNPVILFFGVSEDGKRAAFDVSPEVQLVKTGGRCIGGPRSCGTLLLKKGQAATLATGKPNRSFRLKVTGIDFVEVFRGPKRAGSSQREDRIGFGFAAQSFSK